MYERLIQTPNVQNILRRKEECDCGSKKPYALSLIFHAKTHETLSVQPGQVPPQDGLNRHLPVYGNVYQDIESPGPCFTWCVPHKRSHPSVFLMDLQRRKIRRTRSEKVPAIKTLTHIINSDNETAKWRSWRSVAGYLVGGSLFISKNTVGNGRYSSWWKAHKPSR